MTEEERKGMFDTFYGFADFGKQNAYICGLVHQIPVKTRRPRNGEREGKGTTNLYHVHKTNGTLKVCKKCFLDTFQISDGRMTRALKKIKSGLSPGADLRGKHEPATKIPNAQKQLVMDHINMFPKFQSHYTRLDNPHRQYLDPELNVKKMYEAYVVWCKNKNLKPEKEHYYRFIFNTEFNLHFHVTRKDTCRICDGFKQKISLEADDEEKKKLEQKHSDHLQNAESARQSLRNDREKSKTSADIMYTATFDLQKALPFPRLTVSEAYYRRNMYVYNLGINEVATNQAFMYVWDETLASRGSQEISSCLDKHIRQRQKKHVILYSDTCTGQNRNINVALALMKITEETQVEVIEQKFMVSGHSYLPNDADFGTIELATRKKAIYVPDDWYSGIQTARKKNKFMLVKMQQNDFFSSENLIKNAVRRKKNVDGESVNWMKIQWLQYKQSSPMTILYKYSLNEEEPFKELSLKTGKAGRPSKLKGVVQDKLYNGPRVLNNLKKRDMLFLLKYIPPIYHGFFRNIKSSQDVEDNGPLSEVEEEELANAEDVILNDGSGVPVAENV